MKKSAASPGLLNGSNQISDRVCDTVSPSEQIAVSETSRNVLSRTRQQTPSNEPAIRGTPFLVFPEAYEMLVAANGREMMEEHVRQGKLAVI